MKTVYKWSQNLPDNMPEVWNFTCRGYGWTAVPAHCRWPHTRLTHTYQSPVLPEAHYTGVSHWLNKGVQCFYPKITKKPINTFLENSIYMFKINVNKCFFSCILMLCECIPWVLLCPRCRYGLTGDPPRTQPDGGWTPAESCRKVVANNACTDLDAPYGWSLSHPGKKQSRKHVQFFFAKVNALVCALTRDPDTAMSSSVLILTLTTSSVCPYNTWTGLGQSPTGVPPCSPKEIDRCMLNLLQNEWYESITKMSCSNLLLNLPHHAGCVSGARD